MLEILFFILLKSGNISGTVIDKTTNQPLVGANVCILGTNIGAATDSCGRYIIENVEIKEYAIEASMIGYKPLVKTRIYPIPNKTIIVDFELELAPIKLKGVIVKPEYFPKEKDATVSTHDLSYYEIRSNPEGYDFMRSLAVIPSIAAPVDWSAQIIVRGGNPDENLCLIDNIKVSTPTHFGWFGGQGEGGSIVPTEFIRDVSFFTGGFPAKYGDKLSSAMDIKLKSGNKNKLSGSFSFDMAGMGISFDGPITRKGTYFLSYTRTYLRILDKIVDMGNIIPEHQQGWAKFTYDLTDRNKISFTGGYVPEKLVIPKEEIDAKEDLVWDGSQKLFGINWHSLVRDKGLSIFTLSGTAHKLDFGMKNIFGIKTTLYEINAKESFIYRINEKIESEVGVSCKYLTLNWSSFSLPETTATGAVIPGDTIDTIRSSYKGYSYAQANFYPTTKLQIKSGIRYDYFAYTREGNFSPRIGLSYSILPATSLNFSYGKFYQFPTIDASELKAKNSTHYILGIEHLLAPDMKMTIEGYYKKMNNLFVRISDTTYSMDNTGKGYAKGIDFLLHKKLKHRLHGIISYSYSISKREDRWGKNYPSDWNQPHILNLICGYKISDRFEISIKYRYATGRPYTPLKGRWQDPYTGKWYRIDGDINSERFPPYHRLDFQVSKSHTFKKWRLISFFNLQNILNHKNVYMHKWNADYTKKKDLYMFPFMPVGGVIIKF